eukprot:symbB.v1.2.000037.t1/scaffold12.1/size699752/17
MAQPQKLQKVTEELAEMTSKLASFQEQSAKEKAELTEQIAVYEGRLKSESEARAQDMESEMKKFEKARESAEMIKVELTSAIADKKTFEETATESIAKLQAQLAKSELSSQEKLQEKTEECELKLVKLRTSLEEAEALRSKVAKEERENNE